MNPTRFARTIALLSLFAQACSAHDRANERPDSSSRTLQDPDAAAEAAQDEAADAPSAPLDACAPFDASAYPHLCDLPGTLQWTSGGVVAVGPPAPVDLSFLKLPNGFCAHYFATVGNARQMRVAPGRELFVASPTTSTTGGGINGRAAIVVLPDDDGDGYADSSNAFLTSLPSTQGLLFTPGSFYYQDGPSIKRTNYARGDRTPTGPSSVVSTITVYQSEGHWPKTLDMADDGTIYVTNGGDQSETCDPARPFHGGILALSGDGGASQVAKGFRNPINVRCQPGHGTCYALELALDYSALMGGREKVIPIHQGDDWGYPCCATKNLPYSSVPFAVDCSGVAAESDSLLIGDTPFGIDFERGLWPVDWQSSALIALHGAFATWVGARIVAVATDPQTGSLGSGSTVTSADVGALRDFATGWDDGTRQHGRPSAVTFGPDGRLFVANDNNGIIFWIAPAGL